MEQVLTVFGINWKLMAIQMINFGLLLLLLRRFLYRPVTRILEERRTVVTQGVADAKRAKEDLQEAESKKQGILTEATHQAEAIVDMARTQAKEKERDILKEVQDRGQKLLEEAEQRVQEDRRRLMESTADEVARMAVLAAEKVLRKQKI